MHVLVAHLLCYSHPLIFTNSSIVTSLELVFVSSHPFLIRCTVGSLLSAVPGLTEYM